MTTSTIPFGVRRSVNPILSEQVVAEHEGESTGAFLTQPAQRLDRYMPLVSALTAGAFLLTAYLSEKFHGPQPLTHLTVLIAFILGGIPGLKSAWESLLERRIDIDVLMVLGAVLAAVIDQPIEGALLLFLFALSGALEEEATRRTQSAIKSLRDINPLEAIVMESRGGQHTIPTRFVPIDARVLVRPGDRVPLDGIIVDGESAIDEAPITGESMLRSKRPGDNVFAGTINGEGRLIVQVTKVAGDTQLAKIIRLVTQARGQRPAVERLFDRISPKYAVGVILTAVGFAVFAPLLTHLTWADAAKRAIALLIVASPCALIIATPIAYLSAIASAARRGVLIKGGVYLEVLARAKSVVFDKTGTLTKGEPRVAQIIPHNGLAESAALRAAGALEASSSHPLASAINQALKEQGLEPYIAHSVELVPGRGVRGHIDGQPVALGKTELVEDLIEPVIRQEVARLAEQVNTGGQATAVLGFNGKAAVLAFEDPIRHDAQETLSRLKALGVQRLHMLTGDHAEVARRIADTLGLDGFDANLLPEHKIEKAMVIRESAAPLVMVGDGVNDAPALARADVGIAMASIGSDAALEAAPIVLVNNRLDSLSWLMAHSKRTAGIVRQNLTLAISVIVVLSILAVAGQVQLPVAVIGHEGSTLLVAANALRLLRA